MKKKNHKEFSLTVICFISVLRTIRNQRRDLRNPCRGIVDGDLVFKYSDLPAVEKAEFARKIGTTPAEILDDLAELDRNAAHF